MYVYTQPIYLLANRIDKRMGDISARISEIETRELTKESYVEYTRKKLRKRRWRVWNPSRAYMRKMLVAARDDYWWDKFGETIWDGTDNLHLYYYPNLVNVRDELRNLQKRINSIRNSSEIRYVRLTEREIDIIYKQE